MNFLHEYITNPKPLFSLIYLTYRPGGLDLLVESLRPQLPLYELVVVDDYQGRAERGQAQDYIRKNGINLGYYGPSKPHSYPGHCNGLANAMNTGALHAKHNYIVFLHDFCWLPPGAMLQWAACVQRYLPATVLSGIASRRTTKPPETQGDLTVWHNGPAWCSRNLYEEREEWVPYVFENFYMGTSVSLFDYINGVDERADCGHISWPVNSMAFQATRAKCQLIVDRRLRVDMADHRVWRKEHDCTLWSAEELSCDAEEPTWEPVSPNPYSFKELRAANLK